MAKPGPRPTPTKLKILSGNPGRRPLNENEPKPRLFCKPPTAPRYLDKVGKKEWRRIAKELNILGLVTKLDLVALGGYCACYSSWLSATEAIQKHGVLVKAQSGFPMQSPYVAIANKAMVEMRKWLVEFGMTPSSRSNVVAEPESDDDDDLLT